MLDIQEQPSTYFQKEMSAMTSYIVLPVQVSVHLTFFPMTSQTEIPSNTFMSRPKVKIQTSRQPVCNAQWISQPKWHLDSIKKTEANIHKDIAICFRTSDMSDKAAIAYNWSPARASHSLKWLRTGNADTGRHQISTALYKKKNGTFCTEYEQYFYTHFLVVYRSVKLQNTRV